MDASCSARRAFFHWIEYSVIYFIINYYIYCRCLNDLEILALADPSIHGTENCIKVMRNIDSDRSV